jgi:hypothetical protein
MPQQSPSRGEARQNGDSVDRRRFPRRPVPDVVVAVELSDTGRTTLSEMSDTTLGLAWAGSAIDISPEGLALSLPDDIPLGSEVLLTFRLDDETAFARVPSVVVRKQAGYGLGVVRFGDWRSSDRHALRAYLSAA